MGICVHYGMNASIHQALRGGYPAHVLLAISFHKRAGFNITLNRVHGKIRSHPIFGHRWHLIGAKGWAVLRTDARGPDILQSEVSLRHGLDFGQLFIHGGNLAIDDNQVWIGVEPL